MASSKKTSFFRTLKLKSGAGSAILLRGTCLGSLTSTANVGESLRRTFNNGSEVFYAVEGTINAVTNHLRFAS